MAAARPMRRISRQSLWCALSKIVPPIRRSVSQVMADFSRPQATITVLMKFLRVRWRRLVLPGDVLICLTTSGKSKNVKRALEEAKTRKLKTIAFLGRDGGSTIGMADVELLVRSDSTARIQEAHQLLLHVLCEIAEVASSAQVKRGLYFLRPLFLPPAGTLEREARHGMKARRQAFGPTSWGVC